RPRGVPVVYLNLATTMSKVQITPTRTNAVKPIRIHCSGVQCFRSFRESLLVSHMMRSQYIAVRICPRFVTRPRTNAVLAPQTADKPQNAAGFGFHDRLHH